MYNQNLDECLWILGRQLHLGACKTNDCKQKWTWTKNQQLQSGIDHSLCVSVHQLSVGEKVFMESCNPSKVLQKWECKGDGLLGIQGADLYFNYRSKPSNGIFLLQGTGVWSRWVKYSTRGSICRS